jgi:predicted outer membrane repeat protein
VFECSNKDGDFDDDEDRSTKVGGGIIVSNANLVSKKNKIKNNGDSSTEGGGAVYAAGSGAGVPDPEPQFPPDPDYDERSSIVFEETIFSGNDAQIGNSVMVNGWDPDTSQFLNMNFGNSNFDVVFDSEDNDEDGVSEYWVKGKDNADFDFTGGITGEYDAIIDNVWVDPVNGWDTDLGLYEYVSYMNIIVLNQGEQLGDQDDLLAAFITNDELGNFRGFGDALEVPFGPYEGSILYEMTIYSNTQGESINFKYYDASTGLIYDISETLSFESNQIIGDLVNPHPFYTTGEGEYSSEPFWAMSNKWGDYEHPFKTINYAMGMIYPTEDNFITIYLTAGEFSPTNNNEVFPINMYSNLNLTGQGEEVTILDAEGSENNIRRVITSKNCENNLIRNLKITGGWLEDVGFTGTYLDEVGAGIFCDNSNLRLENLLISNNTTTGNSGGGIYSRASTLIIENTTISANYAGWNETFGWGGGLCITDGGSVDLNNLIILNNDAKTSGGGIFISDISIASLNLI